MTRGLQPGRRGKIRDSVEDRLYLQGYEGMEKSATGELAVGVRLLASNEETSP